MTNKERPPLDHNGEHFQKDQKQDESLRQCWKKSEKGDSEFVILKILLQRKSEERLGEEQLQLCVAREQRADNGAVPGTYAWSPALRPDHSEDSMNTFGPEFTQM